MKTLFVVLTLAALPAAAVPAQGVPFTPRSGLYAEVIPGAFFTLNTSGNAVGQSYSNLQPYFGFAGGYDVMPELSVFGQIGAGWSAGNCFSGEDPKVGTCQGSDNFGTYFFEAGARYRLELASRLSLGFFATVGFAIMTPGLVADPTSTTTPKAAASLSSGPSVGGGIGVDYATRLDHFWVGLDVGARAVLSADARVLAMSFVPRMRYVF